jgi:MscS family membrane protein
VPVWLQRVSGDEDDAVWKIASSTVERVPALWQAYGPPPLVERLPAWLVGVRVGETAPWQWLALALLAPVAIGLAWLAVLALAALARPLARRTRTDFDDRLVRATSRPLRLAAAIGAFHLATLPLGLALPVRRGLASVEGALLVIALIWFALRVVNLLTLMVIRRLEERGNPAARAAVPLGQRGAIALLDGFGFDVTALVAGLGVGGIAVALAAQKSMENLFGGVTLLADRPVAVGDFCRFGERLGFVESIGLRSTRVRTLERTLVTVPNADFSTLQIENYGARDRMWYHPTLGLRYETTPDQLRHVLVGIRRLLYAHPMVDPDPARVRFVGFGAYSLDLEVFAYVRTRDFAEYLEVAEDLNLRIMDLVEASGSGFAFPSQTLYLGRDDGLDEKRAREAEEQVRAWRERRELYLPRFPERAIAELDDTLDWPPAGAPEPAR